MTFSVSGPWRNSNRHAPRPRTRRHAWHNFWRRRKVAVVEPQQASLRSARELASEERWATLRDLDDCDDDDVLNGVTPVRNIRRQKPSAAVAALVSQSDGLGWQIPADDPVAVPDGDQDANTMTVVRVVFPTVFAFVVGCIIYEPWCKALQDLLDVGSTGRGPILNMLGMDQSQFMQNFLTVNGLLFTILCGNTYTSLYSQQERLYHALFLEVSEAKSLLEQACLVCQGRPFFPKVLQSIGAYVKNDLRRLDLEPADLLANRPMDDPLEFILYATSVGVPSTIYDTVRDLRQARGLRLGAMQRKLPPIHFVLLYVLGFLELLAFPLLGAGTASMSRENTVLAIQALFFGAMCGAIVMTLQVIYELWKPFGGAYTVDTVLAKMVRGLEDELRVRSELPGGMLGREKTR